ncbi:DNA polymerase III subunit delta' C-terminal domain-containing protein [Paenisporosarcina sp. TG20]|uniref:DNA polymerase III subunit delta' C-terminal domain-containing protein n=1 Tax=Paenisporosarcina sp. TG20 TaxID=1211706 RepID=UPI0003116490|nr:DNA polymerase III subunit delta' C-terminal domain-containing protein [Paenisporosarcina sp. TG20]
MNESKKDVRKIQPLVMKQLQSVFQKNRVAHAYLFEGEKGTGKVAVMRAFVKLLLCEQPVENVSCETCRGCRRFESGNHPNFIQIEPDGQDIKKDQMLQLIFEMNKTGLEAGRKIYVLHRSDRLNTSAANTLLKFLEEPQGLITAILLTDKPYAVISTIRSRSQIISFAPIPYEERVKTLIGEGLTASMASTVSMLTNDLEDSFRMAKDEQFAQVRKTVLKLVEAAETNVHETMLILHEELLPLLKEKEQTEQALDLLLFAYRDLVTVKANSNTSYTYPDFLVFYQRRALHCTFEQLSHKIEAILKAKQQLHSNMNRTLLMEQLMLNMQGGFSFV